MLKAGEAEEGLTVIGGTVDLRFGLRDYGDQSKYKQHRDVKVE